jgi:hypothetical protein
VVAIGAVVASSGSASAGRTFYGWLYGTEVMPERGVELQTWVYEVDDLETNNHSKTTSLWWGPLIGVTDQLELALPIEFEWISADGMGTNFTLQRFGVEARYRFVSQDPEDMPPFAPLVRVAVKRDVVERAATRLEGDLVGSYQAGPVNVLADLGIAAQLDTDPMKEDIVEARPGAGISIEVIEGLRVGGEIYAELNLQGNDDKGWAGIGPNFAWTYGRFWISGAALVGIYHVKLAPRFMWGVAF